MVLDSIDVWLKVNLMLLGGDCGDTREWCIVAGGVMKSRIAVIAVFLRAGLDRAKRLHGGHARRVQDSRIFVKAEFVRYCIKSLYSPIVIDLELYLTV
jgi:hypothetical protein